MKAKNIAAWVLVSLVLLGILCPAVIILFVRPTLKKKVSSVVNSTAPLDIYVVLDGSGSVRENDWNESLLFGKDLSLQLNGSVPRFRAGMGWFSRDFQNMFDVKDDLSQIQGLSKENLPARPKGWTATGRALCGNSLEANDLSQVKASCTGGAYGRLMQAEALPADDLPDCEEQAGSRMIILVTDGRPQVFENRKLDSHRSNDLPRLAAQWIKSATNVSILGILVGKQEKEKDDKEYQEILYALSSCCPASAMKSTDSTTNPYPVCDEPVNSSCNYMFRMEDYEALKRSIDGIVGTLSGQLQCEGVQEKEFLRPDSRSLWFLLLLLPLLVHQIWQRCLLYVARSSPEARALTAETELTATSSAERADSSGGAATASDSAPRASQTPAEADVESAGFKGKKWAPVRTAYIINGARMDVDYGNRSSMPPSAPNAARRGRSFESVNDFPETALAASPEETPTDTVLGVMSVVHPEELVPAARKFSCHVFVPLALTLVLLPVVIDRKSVV